MTNNSHANCDHDATKAARTACRKAKAARPTEPHIDFCDDCGAQHPALYSHEGQFGQGAIYSVVCGEYIETYQVSRVIFP